MGINRAYLAKYVLAGTFLGAAIGYISTIEHIQTITPHIAPEKDDRIALSTSPGSKHESIGVVVTGVMKHCTTTYQEKNTAISAAHCFRTVANARAGTIVASFHHKTEGEGVTKFAVGGHIVEIAIPAKYKAGSQQDLADPENEGYDIAFTRIISTTEGRLPAPSFPPGDAIASLKVFQAGYNRDKPGLTGDFDCKILPQDKWESPYVIATDCTAMPGSSGGPFLDETGNLVGVAETVTLDPSTGAVLNTNFTPITPGLKKAFEEFQNGKLQGKTEILPNGIRLIKFPYEREPARIPADPAPVPIS